MTTRTSTTRKAPWAAALTALLAVLALVFGVLTVAAPAGAKDNDKTPPGQSETFVPPGQDEGDDGPGKSEDAPGQNKEDTDKKIWICHADVNNNNDGGLGGGTGGEFKIGYNLIEISVNAWENGHLGRHPMDAPAAQDANGTYYCPPDSVTYYYSPNAATKTAHLCVLTGDTWVWTDFSATATPDPATVSQGTEWTAEQKAAEDAKYVAMAEADLATQTAGLTTDETKCTTPTQPNYCPDGVTVIGHPYDATNADDVAFCTTGGTDGGNPEEPLTTTAVEAATVEAPESVAVPAPGKVTQPAKVAVPAPATVPTAVHVPAGDGSSVPTTPTYVLALLALGATALAASAVRLVKAPSR